MSASSGFRSQGFRCQNGCQCRECQGTPADPPSLDILWANLQPAIVRVLRKQCMTRREYFELHSQVYSFLTYVPNLPDENDPSGRSVRSRNLKNGFLIRGSGYRVVITQLYASVRGLVTDHLGEIFQQVRVYHGDALLQHYLAHWKDYRTSSQKIVGICEYMDRFHRQYDLPLPEMLSVYGICLLRWKDQILKPLEPQIIRAVLDMYAADRNGQVIDNQLLRGVIESFVELGMATQEDRNPHLEVYRTFFEEKFLDETRVYYVRESDLFLQENSTCDYVVKVHTRLGEEKDRATKYLHESTLPALNTVLDEELIIHYSNMLDNEFTNLLTDNKVKELKIMDSVLRRIPGRVHGLLRDHIHVHAGGAIARDATQLINDPCAFVLLLLEQYDRYFTIVTDAFDRDLDYSNIMDQAMEAVVNNNAVTVLGNGSQKVAQLVADYCDIVLSTRYNVIW